jgi:hypothetical protein
VHGGRGRSRGSTRVTPRTVANISAMKTLQSTVEESLLLTLLTNSVTLEDKSIQRARRVSINFATTIVKRWASGKGVRS